MNTDSIQTELVSQSPIEAISRAEIDVAIATARAYPRQLSTVKKNMLSFATLDQETAESCFYTLPRGGKNIQGPSVRLAEIAVSSYGNLRAGTRILQTVATGDNPHVIVQAVAMDLENNIQVSIEKRRRITKKKTKENVDEDDINLAANAGSAIAFRDAVFKIVPMALIKPVFEQAKRVAIGDAKTLGDRRARCVEAFGKMGVSKERILARIGKKGVDDITLEDVELLLGLHNAIKDGEATIDEAFQPQVKKPDFTDLPKPPAEPARVEPAPTPADDLSFEQMVDGESPAVVNLRRAVEQAIGEPRDIAEEKLLRWCVERKLIESPEGEKPALRYLSDERVEKIMKLLGRGGPVVGQIKGSA